jgi:hypothetical protein
MNRKIFAIPLLLIPLLASAISRAGASTDGVGSANTSISIVSATVGGVNVNVGTGTGNASTIPGGLAANLGFAAAQTPISVDSLEEIGKVTATVNASDCSSDSSKCSDSRTPSFMELGNLSTAALDGSVTFAGAEASMNPPLYAKAALGQATVTTTIFNGFVQATGISIGTMSNESSSSQATAIQGVSIGNVTVLRIGDLMDVVGSLSVDQLLTLAQELDGDATAPLVSLIQTEESNLNDALAAMAACSVFPTSPVDLRTPCEASAQATIDLLTAQIDTEVYGPGGLDETLRGLPFISINDLNIGANATAYGDHAVATAVGSWGTIQVAGQIVNAPDPYESFQQFSATVTAVENQFNEVTHGNLHVDLTPLATTAQPGVNSEGYQTADSTVHVLGITVYLDPPAAAQTQSARAASSSTPLADVQIGGLQSHAMHKDLPDTNGDTGCTDPNGCNSGSGCTTNCTNSNDCTTNCTNPSGCTTDCTNVNVQGDTINQVSGANGSGSGGGGGSSSAGGPGSRNSNGDADVALAMTGENPLLAYCGLLFVGLALGLRRWLGDAA